jgi:hypothetical protein
MPSFVNGFGKTSFMPTIKLMIVQRFQRRELTISKVHINIVRSYVRSHGNDWNSGPDFSNANSGRDTIEVRHNYIHKNKVKLVGAVINLVHGFKAVPLLNVSRGSSDYGPLLKKNLNK